MKSLLVLGAGASGYAAAIAAARKGARVTLVDASAKTARKVLASGNGRCNLGNRSVTADCYVTLDSLRLQTLLNKGYLVPAFWKDLGILVREDEAGRLYPWSNRAQSVADALYLAADAAGVKRVTAEVLSLDNQNGWTAQTSAGALYADAVVLALGGIAAPSLGATDAGLRLARGLGLELAPTRPMLVALKADPHPQSLKGVRQAATLTLIGKGFARVEQGELLFTDYGLSGVAVMQLSAYLPYGNVISVDLLPQMEAKALYALLSARRGPAYPTADKLLVGLLDKPLSYAVLKEGGVSPLDLPTANITDKQLECLVKALKGWRFTVTDTMGYDAAQVMAGGVRLSCLDDNLQCTRHRGLYCCGELVDVTGLCGGYNLHWAWLSGLTVGAAAVGEGRE